MSGYEGDDRRKDVIGRLTRDVTELKVGMKQIRQELQVGDKLMGDLRNAQNNQAYQIQLLRSDLTKNTETTTAIKTDTSNMVVTFNHLVGFRVICKWLIAITIAVSTVAIAFDSAYKRLRGENPPAAVAPAPGPAR